MAEKIISNKQFIQNIENGVTDFFIAFGIARSSKTILSYEKNQIEVLNEIDDTIDVFNEKELAKSNIGNAIRKQAFYKY